MGQDIYAVVVICNRKAEDSETLNCFKKTTGIRILVADNSTAEFNIEQYCREYGYAYLNMGGNKGLSQAYNKAVAVIGSTAGVVCMFDDDTLLTQDYFDVVGKNFAKYPQASIFLPTIEDEKGLLSPSCFDGLEVKRAGKKHPITDENITGINTGMAITLDVFQKINYDEALFLDYVDHLLIKQAKACGIAVRRIETSLFQNFSDNQKQPLENAQKRFRIYQKDFCVFYRDHLGFAKKKCFLRAVKLCLKYRSTSFIRLFTENFKATY